MFSKHRYYKSQLPSSRDSYSTDHHSLPGTSSLRAPRVLHTTPRATPPSFYVLAPNRVVLDQSKRTANITRGILAGHGGCPNRCDAMAYGWWYRRSRGRSTTKNETYWFKTWKGRKERMKTEKPREEIHLQHQKKAQGLGLYKNGTEELKGQFI